MIDSSHLFLSECVIFRSGTPSLDQWSLLLYKCILHISRTYCSLEHPLKQLITRNKCSVEWFCRIWRNESEVYKNTWHTSTAVGSLSLQTFISPSSLDTLGQLPKELHNYTVFANSAVWLELLKGWLTLPRILCVKQRVVFNGVIILENPAISQTKDPEGYWSYWLVSTWSGTRLSDWITGVPNKATLAYRNLAMFTNQHSYHLIKYQWWDITYVYKGIHTHLLICPSACKNCMCKALLLFFFLSPNSKRKISPSPAELSRLNELEWDLHQIPSTLLRDRRNVTLTTRHQPETQGPWRTQPEWARGGLLSPSVSFSIFNL